MPAYEIIINKAHLLIEGEMPQCLLDFCAHKAGYDVVSDLRMLVGPATQAPLPALVLRHEVALVVRRVRHATTALVPVVEVTRGCPD